MITKVYKRTLSTMRDFNSKKSYLRSIRDMDKFNKIPNYKLDHASNLYNDENGLGEFDRTQVEEYIKRKDDQKLDELDLAKRQLKFQKDYLTKRAEEINLPYEDTIKATERYLNKEASYKVSPIHPEIADESQQVSIYKEFKKENNEKEYGNYSKYFAVEKIVEPGSKPTNEKIMKGTTYQKRLDFIKEKYSGKSSSFKSEVEEHNRRLADRINKDLQRDDLTFDYVEFIKQDQTNANIYDSILESELKLKKANLAKSLNDLKKFGNASRFLKFVNTKYLKYKKKILHQLENFVKREC